jgi:hypothetical protein
MTDSGRAMPLARASDRFVMREGSLHFLMKAGGHEAVCTISLSVLFAIGQTAGMSGPVFAFWTFETIERAASAKYDRTSRMAYEVLAMEKRDLALVADDRSATSALSMK